MITLSRQCLASWVAFTDTRNGRDKIYRFVQYFSKFISSCLSKLGITSRSKWFALCSSSFSNGRKLFRLGRTLDFFLQAINEYDAIQLGRSHLTNLLKNLALGGWLLLDSLIWFSKMKLLPNHLAENFKFFCLYLWLFGLVFSLISQANEFDLQNTKKLEAFSVTLGNLLIPLGFLKLIPLGNFGIGLAGSLTSLIPILSYFGKSPFEFSGFKTVPKKAH